MNAVTQTEARAIQAPALEAADPTKNLILVSLSRLVSRPTGRNVRKTPRMSIPELAASIQRVGLLQNLIVIAAADGEHYEVVAGGRVEAAGEEAPHQQGMGGALPAGSLWHRPHGQPHRERAARADAPCRPV
ncbi:ParB N-terminal domain-containing protein [Stenotrophomonas maltophilia]|uniref:ParB N-terminal domain-containing protein n=1 Tax=Stenotrophomonas maltophilia TaxID=40324 RepID=UPI003D18C9EE